MTVSYKNRKSKTYYLHKGKTKTGKPKYHFSLKSKGELVDEIPEGYEIYEHPAHGQVFLRKKLSQIITDIEKHIVEKELKEIEVPYNHLLDIRGKTITIFESHQDVDALKDIFSARFGQGFRPFGLDADSTIDDIINIALDYSPIIRLSLQDEKKRTFIAERYSFRGSTDDWVQIGGPGSLKEIAKEHVKHLGQDSLFGIL